MNGTTTGTSIAATEVERQLLIDGDSHSRHNNPCEQPYTKSFKLPRHTAVTVSDATLILKHQSDFVGEQFRN